VAPLVSTFLQKSLVERVSSRALDRRWVWQNPLYSWIFIKCGSEARQNKSYLGFPVTTWCLLAKRATSTVYLSKIGRLNILCIVISQKNEHYDDTRLHRWKWRVAVRYLKISTGTKREAPNYEFAVRNYFQQYYSRLLELFDGMLRRQISVQN